MVIVLGQLNFSKLITFFVHKSMEMPYLCIYYQIM